MSSLANAAPSLANAAPSELPREGSDVRDGVMPLDIAAFFIFPHQVIDLKTDSVLNTIEKMQGTDYLDFFSSLIRSANCI